MFFTKYIKNQPVYSKIITLLLYIIITIGKIFKATGKTNSDSVIVVVLHKLGDSVFTIDAIRNILGQHKKNISLMCFPETVPIFRIVFESLNFVVINHSDFYFDNRIAKRRTRKTLKKLCPSVIYDLTGTITSASIIFNSSARKIIGLNAHYYRSIYTEFFPIRTGPHITDIYLDAVPITITSSNNNSNKIKEYNLNDYILIHPFAGTRSKEWGLKKYIYLAEYLKKNFKCIIVSQPQMIPVDILTNLKRKKIELIETRSTADLIEVIKRCSIFIGNDSGPVHIANLLGKPTFTIYGPTNPDYHKPLSGTNDYIIKEIACSPKQFEKMCFTYGGMIGCPSFECMWNLKFDEVRTQIVKFIESIKT